MSGFMMFLLWLSCVAGSLAILAILMLIRSIFEGRRLRPIMEALSKVRCPKCGGAFANSPGSAYSPGKVVRSHYSDPAGTQHQTVWTKQPRTWCFECKPCHLTAGYSDGGQLVEINYESSIW